MWVKIAYAAAVVAVGLSVVSCNHPVRQMVPDSDYHRSAPSWAFEIAYTAKIEGIPAGARQLRLWIPVPQNSPVQKIWSVSFDREVGFHTEPKYGNRIAYVELSNPPSSLNVTMKFKCRRSEQKVDLEKLSGEGADAPDALDPFLGEERYVPISDRIRRIADEVTQGKTTVLDKARAIYDYVVAKMTYDKKAPGWGKGDSERACDVGMGNCTDFHALFNALCRAEGIASGFEIGLYLPYEKREGEPVGGYHCWAAFRVPGKTWVPVDASEASRLGGDKKDYFFGNHTPNRVTLSTGRDIPLVPKPSGESLNYFLNPHCEVDGKEHSAAKDWSYRFID
ncbi:MAG TPA: transglutaminase domain-containing protein [Planctomycetota bacterium]|nr:transglutaminase domain-containing protein [Planctomycetota bacterium]